MARLIFIILLFFTTSVYAETVEELGKEFWAWRLEQAPIANHNDEIWRYHKSENWVADYAPETIAGWRAALDDFEARRKAMDVSGEPVSTQVDWYLLGAGMARARYEMDLAPLWQRSPKYYLDQTIGGVRVLFMELPPIESRRAEMIIKRMREIPKVLEQAKVNITDMRAPYGRYALEEMEDIDGRINHMATNLALHIPAEYRDDLKSITVDVVAALLEFKAWIERELPNANPEGGVGREAMLYKLHNIQLIPYTTDEMVKLAAAAQKQETAWNAVEGAAKGAENAFKVAEDLDELIANMDRHDKKMREELEARNFLTVPDWIGPYRIAEMPEYLKPIKLWSANNLNLEFDKPGKVHHYYQFPKGEGVGSSAGLSIYNDPRSSLVHNGVPGHTLLLALAGQNKSEIRRYPYSSTSLEGVPAYAQMAMQKAGFFDDNPWMENSMRGGLARWTQAVPREINVHSGDIPYDIAVKTNTMISGRLHNAMNGVGSFMGYYQLMDLVAEEKLAKGDDFSLRAFHDYLWENNNVPAALLRWERLGLRDHVDRLDELMSK